MNTHRYREAWWQYTLFQKDTWLVAEHVPTRVKLHTAGFPFIENSELKGVVLVFDDIHFF